MLPEKIQFRTARGILRNSVFDPNSLFVIESSCHRRAGMDVRGSNVEIHLTLNRSCRWHKPPQACCSRNSEPAVHLTLNFRGIRSFNFELSDRTGSRAGWHTSEAAAWLLWWPRMGPAIRVATSFGLSKVAYCREQIDLSGLDISFAPNSDFCAT